MVMPVIFACSIPGPAAPRLRVSSGDQALQGSKEAKRRRRAKAAERNRNRLVVINLKILLAARFGS